MHIGTVVWVVIVLLNASLLLQHAALATADDSEITLKRRRFNPRPEDSISLEAGPRGRHLLVQFHPGMLDVGVAAIEARGAHVLEFVPKYAVSVYLPRGISLKGIPGLRWVDKLQVEDKIPTEMEGLSGEVFVIISAFPDVDRKRLWAHVRRAGGRAIENPFLKSTHSLVAINAARLTTSAANDDVSFIFPASADIAEGKPVHFCEGPMTPVGPLGEYVTNGDGWDGQGLGSAALKYHFVNGTGDISGSSEWSEVRRALNTWSRYAQITWTESASANQNRSFDISWVTGDHGDGYPFDGPPMTGRNNVLAHCFYPSPPNSETIAGDMHLDDDESWRVGSHIDLFSVALHEAGHGLGLNHSSDTNAVMYPYYQIVSDLRSDDIAGIQSLYASGGGGGGTGDAFEPDNTSGQAKVISSGSNQSHSIIPATDVDYVKFTLTSQAAVTIETDGDTGDTRMWLYNGALTEIDFDDDSGSGYFSRIDRTTAAGNSLPSGTYYVKVDEYGNNDQLTTYTISLDLQYLAAGDSFEPDNGLNQAKLIASGSPQVHSISPAGDDDYVTFVLTAPSEVLIETSGVSGDTTMHLFGSDASEIEFDDDGGAGLFSRIDRTNAEGNILSPGTYYVLVGEYLGDDQISSYTLSLSVTPLATDDAYEQNDTRIHAFHPGFNWEATPLSSINGPGVQSDDDWYRIDVTPGGYERVIIDCLFAHVEGDVDIALHNSSGAVLASSLGVTDSEHIDFTVAGTGTYYIRVFGSDNGTTYDLTWDDLRRAAARPPNDAFEGRLQIFGNRTSRIGSNLNATKEPGEPYHAGTPGGASIWWEWTASSSGTVCLNTLGSEFDTLLAIYAGSTISNLVPIAANDDDMGTLASFVTFDAVQGATYQIAIDGFNAQSGSVYLSVNQPDTNYEPDGILGFTTDALLGDGIYDPSGGLQALQASVRPNHSRTCLLFAQNDGGTMDILGVTGTRGSSAIRVQYYYGDVDVTADVVGGTFRFPAMEPGGTDMLTIVAHAKKNAKKGRRVNLTLTLKSTSDPSLQDVLHYNVKVR
jgi:hypothetical protein